MGSVRVALQDVSLPVGFPDASMSKREKEIYAARWVGIATAFNAVFYLHPSKLMFLAAPATGVGAFLLCLVVLDVSG